MEYPLVTVIIPVYNRQYTIRRAIDSVLKQTYKNIELIIVDDCSTDATVNIIKEYKDKRICLICLIKNQGANFARNRGIEKAKGEFIAFQDSDDEWLADKLEKQISCMLKEKLKASFCPYILYEGKQNSIIPNDYQNIELYQNKLEEKLKRGNIVGTPTLVVKKEVFFQIGMFDEKMKRLQDYEFIIRFVKNYKLGYIYQPLVKAYRMEKSISTDKNALLDAYVTLTEKHFDFIDLQSVIDNIFNCTNVFGGNKINWNDFDRVIDVIKKKRLLEEQDDIYKWIVDYVYEKYFSIKRMLVKKYDFFCKLLKTKRFAIYGAGTYGEKVYYELKMKNLEPECFFVTELSEELEIDGIPINKFSLCSDKDLLVIIAVSWDKQNEIIESLQLQGVFEFCIYPFC